MSKDALRKLFFAFIQPHLDYDLLIWNSTNKTNIKTIKTNAEKAVRKILFKKYNENTEPLFKELIILDLDKSNTSHS